MGTCRISASKDEKMRISSRRTNERTWWPVQGMQIIKRSSSSRASRDRSDYLATAVLVSSLSLSRSRSRATTHNELTMSECFVLIMKPLCSALLCSALLLFLASSYRKRQHVSVWSCALMTSWLKTRFFLRAPATFTNARVQDTKRRRQTWSLQRGVERRVRRVQGWI